MSTIGRMKLFFALGLIAAVFVALGPLQASAAAPSIKTGSRWVANKCLPPSGGENACSFKSNGDRFAFLTVSGKNFTPNGEVRIVVVKNGTNHVLVDATIHANSKGRFGVNTNVELNANGDTLAVIVLDEDAGVLANIVYVKGWL